MYWTQEWNEQTGQQQVVFTNKGKQKSSLQGSLYFSRTSPRREQKVGVESQEQEISGATPGGGPLGWRDLCREFSLGEDQVGKTLTLIRALHL